MRKCVHSSLFESSLSSVSGEVFVVDYTDPAVWESGKVAVSEVFLV